MKHGGQKATNAANRYELRSSVRGIDTKVWREAVRNSGIASGVVAQARGYVTVITFDTTDPIRVRTSVCASVGTENFSVRMTRRLPVPIES